MSEASLIEETVRQTAKRFTERYWIEKDRAAEFPKDFLDEAARLGLTSLLVPSEHGGVDVGVHDYVGLVKLVSSLHGVAAGDILMAYNTFGAHPLFKLGSAEQKKKFAERLVSGEANPCVAVTEPTAGSDTLSVSTTAERSADGYTLRGRKIWITMAHISRQMIVVARTSNAPPGRRAEGLTLFLIDPKEYSGIRTSRIDDIALRALGSCEVFFDDVHIPKDAVLGEEGKGWRALTSIFNLERLSTASISLGTAELVLNKTVEHAQTRIVYGRPIGANQAVQFPLAEGKVLLEAAWRLVSEGASKMDRGEECAFEANGGALLAAKSSNMVADTAMQIFGGMAFALDTGVELHWRNLRLFRVGPVPEELALSYVAHNVLKLPRSF
ncbi:MAG: acyl-CoA dehydrogenase family protein [Thermoprotei archaeon]